MITNLYAVLDSASGIYDGPVPQQADGVALRGFTNMAKNPQSPIGQNPECFSLWRVGKWNDATGEVVPEVKECLGHAVDLINENENKELN
jgi:hypothetical protein